MEKATPVQQAKRALALAIVFLKLGGNLVRQRPVALVIGSSAGGVMLFDASVSVLATLLRVPVFVYHHSFAYLRRQTTRWYHRLGLRMMSRRQHIVLCEGMGEALARQYGIGTERITVVSNAAHVRPAESMEKGSRGSTLCLGFLSYVTLSKGIFDFLALVDRLQQQGVPVTALVAGSLDSTIADRFNGHIAEREYVQHLGAVAGRTKADFFEQIDLLVLPSRHPHEAEPLVVIESLSYGVPVLATPRGCLPSAWAHSDAVHLVDEDDFAGEASVVLQPWLSSSELRSGWSRAALDAYKRMHNLGEKQLETTIRNILRRDN